MIFSEEIFLLLLSPVVDCMAAKEKNTLYWKNHKTD